jgi:hypothetical protein
MTPESDLDRRIITATDRPHVARSRRWHRGFPKYPGLTLLQQWEREVADTLLKIERAEDERAARGKHG